MNRCSSVCLARRWWRRSLRAIVGSHYIPSTFGGSWKITQYALRCPVRSVATSKDDEFVFDPTLSVQRDAAVKTAKESLDNILQGLVPSRASEEARQKVRAYLQQHPIDTLITQPRVQITHLEDKESGTESKISLSPCDLSEALQQAQERGMNLVQMGTRGDVAYCRIRNEMPRVQALISAELEALSEQEAQQSERGDGRGAAKSEGKMRELIDHAFRDAVDAHFVGWRSKKIVEDIKKRHPVKLTIKEFQSPEAAIGKLREMCLAMQRHAEELVVYHHFTSIVANDREASITFAPSLPRPQSDAWKHIKYPGEKEWASALKRMEEACRKSGRYGTYAKSNKPKMRSLGQTAFRVDKYGRKID
uniref:Uncharacterized protein n=1 Tax=Trypanosoma congolense (strain IL3000) TaxID=1068625 RepID=G0UPG7_TRYCI|nr:conserved hypothetical protein [Trypanosoma congolense IL3000]